jgi:hypothetical protein
MAVAIQQISPVAHLSLVLGVVRKLNVAALIDTFCPPHPAHVLSCGRGVEACSWRFSMVIMPSIRWGHVWRSVGCYLCSSPASHAPRSMIIGWGRSSMRCLPRISTACLGRSPLTPWRSMPSRPRGFIRIRRRSPYMGPMRRRPTWAKDLSRLGRPLGSNRVQELALIGQSPGTHYFLQSKPRSSPIPVASKTACSGLARMFSSSDYSKPASC